MRNKCLICNHPKRKEIEKEFILKSSIASLVKKYFMSRGVFNRHFDRHLPDTIVNDRKNRMPELKPKVINTTKGIPELINLSSCIEYIHGETLYIHNKAKERGDHDTSLKALKQDLECLNLVIRTKELIFGYKRQENWDITLAKILKILDKHKDIKEEIAEELFIELGGKSLLEKNNYTKGNI